MVDTEDIYVYLDMVDGSENEYFCRSFVANPDYDRTVGQIKLTTLWQEKIDLCAGTSEVIYQYKNFTPKDLKKWERRIVLASGDFNHSASGYFDQIASTEISHSEQLFWI